MQHIIARAQNSSHLDSSTEDGYTHDTDALAAVGARASRLASLLLRIRNAGQSQWIREAVIILSQGLRHHGMARSMSDRVALAALQEWANPHCRQCHGARQTQAEKLLIICPSCNGSGTHRYSDSDRERMCGAKFVGRVAMAHGDAMRAISEHVGDGVRGVRGAMI